jgi:uncharacterized protein (TIGR03435 family)
MSIRQLLYFTVSTALTLNIYGQPPNPTAELSFEVASVRLNRTGQTEAGTSFELTPDRLTVRNYPIAGLIMRAYNADQRQLSTPGNAPLPSERYDIDAKAPSSVNRTEMMLMLQRLLVDRFKLAISRQEKKVSGYTLVLDRVGHKLRENVGPGGDCTAGRAGNGELSFRHCAMQFFAVSLTAMTAGRFVVDRTGLEGNYDFELLASWESPSADGGPKTINPGAPSIFDALRRQLGLRLASEKITVSLFEIDHIEKPTEN